MSLLSLDARWRRFNDPDHRCPCCGMQFHGIFDIGFDHPSAWPHAPREQAEVIEAGSDRLASELCRLGDTRYLRAILTLPVQGAEDAVNLSLWAGVPPATFYAYIDALTSGDWSTLRDSRTTLANDLPMLSIPSPEGMLDFDDGTTRPLLNLAPLTTTGITFDQLLDLYAATGDDLRPHLSQS